MSCGDCNLPPLTEIPSPGGQGPKIKVQTGPPHSLNSSREKPSMHPALLAGLAIVSFITATSLGPCLQCHVASLPTTYACLVLFLEGH